MTPKILLDLVNDLKTAVITAAEKVEGEGRAASTLDEGNVKRWMFAHPKWKMYAKDVPPRHPGDVLIVDGDMIYPINIKTTLGTSTDNATSKAGFLYAFTDVAYDDIPTSITAKKFYELVYSRKIDIPEKDYWYLCFDKIDMTNVTLRGCKQITCWVENANPANLLQINWKKERLAAGVTLPYTKAFDNVIGGIERCWLKSVRKLPQVVLDKL